MSFSRLQFGALFCLTVALFSFYFTKPALADRVIYNSEGYWITQDYSINFNTATSGVAFIQWLESDTNACQAHADINHPPRIYIDGTPFEQVNTTDNTLDNGQNYYIGYASSTILSGIDHQLTIDTDQIPPDGYTCQQFYNLFILDNIVASSVSGFSFANTFFNGSAQYDYNFPLISQAQNQDGLTGIQFLGTQTQVNLTPTSSMIDINNQGYHLFSAYKDIPQLFSGYNQYGFSSLSAGTYGYIYGVYFPFETTIYYYIPDILLGLSVPADVTCCQGVNCSFNASIAPQSAQINWSLTNECGTGVEIASGTAPSYSGSFNVANIFTDPIIDTLCLETERTIGTQTYWSQTPINYYVLASSSATCGITPPDPSFCNTPCDGIATSTFGGDINCGLRSAIAWSVCVSPSIADNLMSTASLLRSRFPFSVWYSLIDTAQSAIDSFEGNQAIFKFPMISESTTTITMLPILNSSSTEKLIGKNNSVLFRNVLTWLFYGLLVSLFALIAWPKKK